jgi:geranylgeranyl diphosphate synthase type II
VNIEAYLKSRRAEIETTLEGLLPQPEGPGSTVIRASRYALDAGGKRLRPILALTSCEACGGHADGVAPAAAALELIHTYSLIHDDLPAMDDDDLRRGQPTVHREFNEAVAILAGDALNTLAFEWLATYPEGDENASRRARAVALVARGTGLDGMVGGQIADLEAEHCEVDEPRLQWIHGRKTAALFSTSAELGALHAGADDATCAALAEFGRELGLAFQIVDDVLDCTQSTASLGKTAGKDERAGKATFPALFGLEESRARAQACASRAAVVLQECGLRDERLEALVRFAVERVG